jgi:anti-sigma regulatory factor (Ser/Thr protein kinase)/ActR/RegA family two-component response regulator
VNPIPRSVLIVEPDNALQARVAGTLTSRGWVVGEAHSGEQALEQLGSRSYDVVVADVEMPCCDGVAMMQRIRGIAPQARVLLVAGASTPECIISALRQQAFTFFQREDPTPMLLDGIEHAAEVVGFEGDVKILSSTPHWVTMEVRCTLRAADRVVQVLYELESQLPQREREEITTACREMLMNAVEHGAKSDPNLFLTVSCIRTSDAVLYQIKDPGPGFSINNVPHAAISNRGNGSSFEHLSVREEQGLRPGGYGILMTRNLVDELIYNEAGNEVLLIKHRKPAGNAE